MEQRFNTYPIDWTVRDYLRITSVGATMCIGQGFRRTGREPMPISRLECPADGSHTDGLPGRWVTPGKNGGNAADMLVSYERLFGPSSPGSPVLARTYRSGAVVTHLAQLRSPEDDLPIAMFAKVDGLKPDQRIAFGHFRNDGYSNILRILPANAYRDTPDSMQPLEDPRYAAGVHVSGWRQRQV